MIIKVFPDKTRMAANAAEHAAGIVRKALNARGEARIIAATGASQFEFLEALVAEKGIDWARVEMFHLDEYVGVTDKEPASFCKYLRERLIDKTGIKRYHLLDGTRPPAEVIAEVTAEITKAPIDVAFAGVGENGHLAFNDPPADFKTTASFLVANLDEACRRQQFSEGWFATIGDVPKQAISMSISELMKAKEIIVCAADTRKASAIKACFEGPVTPDAPSSILQEHAAATLYLDAASAALLQPDTLKKYAA